MDQVELHPNGNGAGVYASRGQLAELDRQVERGSLFTQATLQRGFRRIDEAESLVAAMIRALTAKGIVSEEELGVVLHDNDEAAQADDGAAESGEEEEVLPVQPTINWPTIALRVDDPDVGEAPEVIVDCDARMHVCHAVCCKLKFPLNTEEVETGVVKWDIGHPYIIRQESSGWCTHNDTATGRCGIYADRPGICRRYSCANDTRIWKDFDNMVLNDEWISEHLGRRDLHITSVLPSMEEPG
ncbi:MAG: YkgJ family cysteine cluster protein [Actinomycetota bacterium]|nr:YkgJ family cysteine cluster protein [Actinomycetota bacterium]